MTSETPPQEEQNLPLPDSKTTAPILESWTGKSGYDTGYQLHDIGIKPPLTETDDPLDCVIQARYAALQHIENLEKLTGKEITIFKAEGLPELVIRYRTSIKGETEGIATIELCLKEDDKVSPIFHTRLLEFPAMGRDSLVVTAMQRYTNEKLDTVEKPFYTGRQLGKLSMGEPVVGKEPLRVSDPKRYDEYKNETRQIAQLERHIGENMETICLLTAVAFARSKGDRQIISTTYENQYWIRLHKGLGDLDDISVQNNYDPAATRLGFELEATTKNWWILKDDIGGRSPTIDQDHLNDLNAAAIGIAQKTFAGFNEALNQNH